MPITRVRLVTSWRTSPRRIVGYGSTGRSIAADPTAEPPTDRCEQREQGERAAKMELDRHRGADVGDEAHPTEHRRQRDEAEADEARHGAAHEAGRGGG